MPRQSRGRPAAPPSRPVAAPARPAAGPPAQQRTASTAAHPPQQAQTAHPVGHAQGPGLFGQMASTAAYVSLIQILLPNHPSRYEY